MSRRGLVAAVIGEFCAGMGLEYPGLDANDRITLNFGPVPITLSFGSEPAELVWINADLGNIPADGVAAPKFLMHLAFECWTTNRMTIGLGPEGEKVWGYNCISAVQLTKETLEQTVTAMLEAAVPIRERIADRNFEIAAGGAPQPDGNFTRV